VIILKPRLSRGFFLADAHAASHFEASSFPTALYGTWVTYKFPKEEALIWATIFAVVLIAVGSTYACGGPTYVLQSITG
jgi:hypothetical protein